MSALYRTYLLCLAALASPLHAHEMMGNDMYTAVMLDRLEAQNSSSGHATYWEGQGWVGGDMNKAWFKTQGDAAQGRVQTADAQLLYSHAVAPYWDVQAGARHDFQTGGQPAREWLALALKGLAPYNFDVDASIYAGSQGAAARLKANYTLLLTQRLALVPEVEANLYSRTDPQRALGSGLSSLDFSLRLKYEIQREFAPYLGATWSGKYGATANYARLSGQPASRAALVVGVRLWW